MASGVMNSVLHPFQISFFSLLGGMGVLVMNDTPEETNLNLVFIILLLPTIILVSVTDSVSGGELLRHRFVGLSLL